MVKLAIVSTPRKRTSEGYAGTVDGVRGQSSPSAAREHDVYVVGVSEDDEDEDTSSRRFPEKQVMQTTRFARQHAFPAFDSRRADNAKYSDTHIVEVFSHMAMAGCGTEQGARRNGRSPFRDESPYHPTMLRVLKQMGTPDQQRTLSDFREGRDILWERIREAVLDPFDTAVGQIIDRVDGYDAFTQPAVTAIDITTWQFWPYPYTDEKDENGDRIPKEDYPDMVSGTKEKGAYAYKMATRTIVANNVPLILAVEPVKDDSEWDDGDTLPGTRSSAAFSIGPQSTSIFTWSYATASSTSTRSATRSTNAESGT